MSEFNESICLSALLSEHKEIFYGFCNKSANYDACDISEMNVFSKCVKLKQVHSDIAHTVDTNISDYEQTEGDALICSHKGVCVGVYTADCVPILLYNKNRSVVAAVHAGWRGTLSGIISKTIQTMNLKYNTVASESIAVIGPSIGRCCYEVGSDVASKFIEKYKEADTFIYPRGDKYMLDLQSLNRQMLSSEGVQYVECMDICTRCDIKYNSYRREGKGVKSQLSFIGLKL